ncbi:TQO small subunit DoxD [Niabella ginsengisoli]|uniref:DoxX family membrane protein n=1 Tax=Niabella ginsengisoli TaxID=522298 RepID=A0ABS9SG56_9BACT|nr:TQO small subunit DoxD [Niabella ginsengisoli]MCH5597343.1 hypothetical protein [Niabella ginsengisoli]
MEKNTYLNQGLYTLALRLVVGWTYFSAFWRRLILENKLNPDEAGYIGEKFNHFLPNALGIKPIIEYLVSSPDALWWAMSIFTIVEGIAGLLFIFGLFTRLMSIVVFSLAFGILLASGWLGTTCLDEWQIGVLGVAAGFTVFLSGGGQYSLDAYFIKKKLFTGSKWFKLLGSGMLPLEGKGLRMTVLTGSILILGLTLFTNQYFHGGVYGKLHNLSVRPHVDISNTYIKGNTLSFTVFRDEGADVYGSFLIGIKLADKEGNIVFGQKQEHLSKLTTGHIKNAYVAKVKPGKHSLILPLGAKATIQFIDEKFSFLQGSYTLELVDISGITWKESVEVN